MGPDGVTGTSLPCPAPAALLSKPLVLLLLMGNGISRVIHGESLQEVQADAVPQGWGPCALLQQVQLPPSCMCGQAAPALAIAMTLAKVSSAQCAAGTSVPSFQHVGDCIFPPRAQSIRESPGYQHTALEGEHVEVRVTLPGSSGEGLHKVALWSCEASPCMAAMSSSPAPLGESGNAWCSISPSLREPCQHPRESCWQFMWSRCRLA